MSLIHMNNDEMCFKMTTHAYEMKNVVKYKNKMSSVVVHMNNNEMFFF